MEQSYTIALFVHIGTVFLLVAGLGVIGVAEVKAEAASTLDDLRSWVGLVERTAPVLGLSALIILLSGMYMAHERWGSGAPWVVAALIGLVVFALSGPLVIKKGIVGALVAAEAANSVTPEVRQRLRAPALRWISSLRPPLLLWFAYVMVAKPAPNSLFASIALALAAGAVIFQVRARRHRGAATGG